MRVALSATALVLAAIVGPAAPAMPAAVREGGGPVPLRGAPLGGETGLRLLVADKPPFVLDVDSGTVSP